MLKKKLNRNFTCISINIQKNIIQFLNKKATLYKTGEDTSRFQIKWTNVTTLIYIPRAILHDISRTCHVISGENI